MAALIDAGKVTPRTKITVPAQLQRQDRPINDYFAARHDPPDPDRGAREVLQHRHGAGGRQFEPGSCYDYLRQFGLGRPHRHRRARRDPGILPARARWTSQIKDRIAFGQALSVNAVQMAAAINTIANGGVCV